MVWGTALLVWLLCNKKVFALIIVQAGSWLTTKSIIVQIIQITKRKTSIFTQSTKSSKFKIWQN